MTVYRIVTLLAALALCAAFAGAASAAKPSGQGPQLQSAPPQLNTPTTAAIPKCPKGWKRTKLYPEGAYECQPDTSLAVCPDGFKRQWVGCGFGCYVDIPPPR